MSLASPVAAMKVDTAPSSKRARQRMQEYLLSLPAASNVQSSNLDAASIVRQSAMLTNKVDALHAQITTTERRGPVYGDEANQWSQMLALVTDLKRLLSRIQAVPPSSRTKALDECRETTLQNISIVQALLDLASSSTSTQDPPSGFTAPIAPSPSLETSNESIPSHKGSSWDFALLKEKALQGLDSVSDSDESEEETDDGTSLSRQNDEDRGQASEAESVLTDPEDHVSHPVSSSKPLGALRKDAAGTQVRAPLEESDFDEYGPSAPSITPASVGASNAASSTKESASDSILQGDRSTQEALSGELLRMASILKSNSLAFADALERDRVLLEKAGNHLGQNLDLMTKTRGRLGVYSKKVRSMGWFTLGAIAVVMFSWVFMFIVIRLT